MSNPVRGPPRGWITGGCTLERGCGARGALDRRQERASRRGAPGGALPALAPALCGASAWVSHQEAPDARAARSERWPVRSAARKACVIWKATHGSPALSHASNPTQVVFFGEPSAAPTDGGRDSGAWGRQRDGGVHARVRCDARRTRTRCPQATASGPCSRASPPLLTQQAHARAPAPPLQTSRPMARPSAALR